MNFTEQTENNILSTNEKKANFTVDLFEWIDVFVKAIIVVVLLFTFVFKIATIQGNSMQNTFFNGEKVVISNFLYEPKRGDVVVVSRNYTNYFDSFERNEEPIIKRIIAVEGQKVDIDFVSGKVTVDGEELKEEYIKTPTNLSYDVKFPVTVPENCVFLLGDNRNDSLDSRSSTIGDLGTGMMDKRYILGKVLFRIFPFNKIGGFS